MNRGRIFSVSGQKFKPWNAIACISMIQGNKFQLFLGGGMRKKRVFRIASGLLLAIFISTAQTALAAADKIDLSHEKQTMEPLSKIIADENIRPPLASLGLPCLHDFQQITNVNRNEINTAFDFDWKMLEFKSHPHLTVDSLPNSTANDSEPRLFGILDPALFRFQEPGEPIPIPAVLILVGLIALIALKRRRR
jgi:hypothetical protein